MTIRAWFIETLTLIKKYRQANIEYRRAIKKLRRQTGLSDAELRRRVASQMAHWERYHVG